MNSEEKRPTIRMLLLGGIVVAFIITLFGYRVSHNKSYKNEAVERGESIYLNGKEYCYGNPEETYTISNILICKTDSGKKVYEIKEYTNYEYIAVYSDWDGTIYKEIKYNK
ncbi:MULTISPECIES: hypothetical protein [unclassified Clostridium]|uniref:hypothetical protein n=1 Tax=unclassified Clostridium TaxID=2614128 RepID=UPI001C8C83C8|nr:MULTISPECIES: hypothetical protein [unclassified Clostridium]MBX9136790.1 hypothetical protein [Clostridium sp. K12(2020)]MBX9143600.1 hypothetical protein [Clostridium sp. K13]MDU2288901.1 hypothetical protein [Clostridium celatum]MDU4325923.1 hypothetical protein [Clostridium celatum]